MTVMTALPALTLSVALAAAQGPAACRAELDVPYAAGGDERKLDLHLPAKPGFPTVVFTWGGGWHRGGRKSVTPVGQTLRRLGYGCALVSHRLAPRDRFPAQAE